MGQIRLLGPFLVQSCREQEQGWKRENTMWGVGMAATWLRTLQACILPPGRSLLSESGKALQTDIKVSDRGSSFARTYLISVLTARPSNWRAGQEGRSPSSAPSALAVTCSPHEPIKASQWGSCCSPEPRKSVLGG